MGLCQNCGAEIQPGTIKCAYCGAAVQPSMAMPPTMQPGMAVPPPAMVPVGVEQKSKIAAGVLGILVGWLGVHNFYLGFTGKAVAQLLLTILTCGYGGMISGIWGLIEGIMILTGGISRDARGVPLKD
ncbi:MAG: zinc-ribbon domain and TM2 domain-containing protein [Phycisphaerales bacterium]